MEYQQDVLMLILLLLLLRSPVVAKNHSESSNRPGLQLANELEQRTRIVHDLHWQQQDVDHKLPPVKLHQQSVGGRIENTDPARNIELMAHSSQLSNVASTRMGRPV